MRKSTIIVLIGCTFLLGSSASASQQDELLELAATAADLPSLTADNWQVTTKEDISTNKARRLLDNFKAKHEYKVISTDEKNAVNYTINYRKEKRVTEQFHMTIPKSDHQQTVFSVILQGDAWNDKIEQTYRQRMNSVQSSYFTDMSTTFACLEADIDVKIKDVYIIRQMKNSLRLENIKIQRDNVDDSSLKTIVYGYTPQWKQIMTLNQPANFQMAIHDNTNGGKRLTIGTPILINEY